MANMNMIIHDMEGKIELGDTFKNPQFRTLLVNGLYWTIKQEKPPPAAK